MSFKIMRLPLTAEVAIYQQKEWNSNEWALHGLNLGKLVNHYCSVIQTVNLIFTSTKILTCASPFCDSCVKLEHS